MVMRSSLQPNKTRRSHTAELLSHSAIRVFGIRGAQSDKTAANLESLNPAKRCE
jgi:hypothetical protein